MQNNFPPQPTNVNDILSDAAAKAMIQTGAIQKPALFTPLSLTIASSLVAGGLAVSLHVLASLGVLNERWKPDLPIVLPLALVGGAIVGRSAIALSTVEEIKVKKRRRPLPEPLPVPMPEPQQWAATETYEAQYQAVEEPEYEEQYQEEEIEPETELPDNFYQDELEDFWGERDRQAVRG